MKKRICITGAGGSIGHRLTLRLLKNGYTVRAILRNKKDGYRLQEAGAQVMVANLTDPQAVAGLFDDCSLIYHTAAKILGSNHQDFWQTNVVGTSLVMDEALRAGVTRFVHISSVAVYGYPIEKKVNEGYVWSLKEDPYISTKQAAEKIIWNKSKDIMVTVIRPGEVIGPNQLVWTSRIIKLIKLGLLHIPLNAGYMNPVYIENLIDSLVLVGMHNAAVGEAFNVVDGIVLETADYIEQLARIVNRKVLTVPSSLLKVGAWAMQYYRENENSETYLTSASINYLLYKTTISNEKICNTIGWIPSINIATALNNIQDWYLRSIRE